MSRHTLARARSRPVLLFLVYGAFLALIGITATAQAVLASAHFTASVMNSVVAADRSIIGAFVSRELAAADVDPAGLPPDRRDQLQSGLDGLLPLTDVQGSQIMRVEVRTPDGVVLLSNDVARTGARAGGAGFAEAAAGSPGASLSTGVQAAASFGDGLPADVVEEYLPVMAGGEVLAVIAIARDAETIVARLDQTRDDIVLLTVAGGVIVSVLLFFIFRAAQNRISRQTEQLVEAAQRDSLTGLLNHGSVSELLAEAVAEAAEGGRAARVGIALIDIDNFGLLNQTHGHRAGDEALKRLAALIGEHLAEPFVIGRFGPDEFLVVASAAVVGALESAIGRLRSALNELTLQFAASERLPVTVSAGIAIYPDHAQSVTDLVSTATLTLNEAKSSGGDMVRVANRTADERADARGFDVLQGLVMAVDTKDRYTKRHSEDVARYAAFIARRMGLDEGLESTIRLTGLLHDVGKIGIPDSVLRKPGRLTEDENEIVKQHVALGDAIVRDLPHVELVRAGIRHHHERWDGTGYLDHLEAEEIPIIARILAVADVFSAMTTTRPYRKALSLEEALKRLGAAAGSQLDEELVKIFIAGIETAPDAPLPGAELPPRQLWTPSLRPA